MRQIDPHPDADVWDSFVAGHPAGHFLQSTPWSQVRGRWGWGVRRVALVDAEGAIEAGAQVFSRPTPLGSFAYVPRGPVCRPDAELRAVVAAVRSVTTSALAIRYEPHWLDSATASEGLRGAGLVPAPPVQPRSTVRLDLEPPEDQLLAAMKSKWRYNVRLASRRGISIREGDATDLGAFGQMLIETADRDGFAVRPAEYYAAVWQAFRPHGHLLLAEYEGVAVAAIMTIHFGPTATYLYGASSGRERHRMPNHLLQWAGIRLAKADGRRWYDFWGVPDEVGQACAQGVDPLTVAPRGAALAGVWGFKRGFGGRVERTVGAWDDVRHRLRLRLLMAARRAWTRRR